MADSGDKPAPMALEEEEEESLLGLDVALGEAIVGEDDTFRTQNASLDDMERRNVIERTRGNIHTRVDLLDVAHGTMDDGDDATLMIFRFRFDSQKNSRRVILARAKIEFFSAKKNGVAPVVDAIAPDGRYAVKATTDQESTTKGGQVNLGASGVPFLTAGGGANLERTVSRDISDATTVTGSINLGTGKNSGDSTVAAWTMLENKRRETGVPDSVKVAILLRREDDKPFNAKVTLEADVDFMSKMEQKFMKLPLDDPVLFNPKLTGKKPKKGRSYGVENLSADVLEDLCEVRMSLDASFVAGQKAAE